MKSKVDITELEDKLLKLKKAVDEDMPEGMSVVDHPDDSFEDDDEAGQWLAQQHDKAKVSHPSSSKWEAGEVSDKQKEIIDQAMKDGHTEKEAHWLAGQKVHGTKAEAHSSKVFGILKEAAQKHIDNEAYNARVEASESVNPAKYAEGRRIDAFAHHTDDYKQAHNDFLSSDDLKDLSPRDRHAAIQAWKSDYKAQNQGAADYHKNIRDTESAEQATGAAQRKVSPLEGDHKKWFDYTVNEHMPEIEKNINYLRAKGQVPANIEHGDMVAHGVNGLMDALSRYDEDVAQRTYKEGANPFTKYAAQRIRGRMLDHVKTERGPQGDAGQSGMSTAEAAQHLGITGDGENLPGMSISGGSSKAHQHLDEGQQQRMQSVSAAKAIRRPKGGQ